MFYIPNRGFWRREEYRKEFAHVIQDELTCNRSYTPAGFSSNLVNDVVELLKQTKVKKITVVSAAPEIVNKNIYGLDIPTKGELISYHYNPTELAKKYGVEHVVFQDIENLYKTITFHNKNIRQLEVSIFNK